MQLLFCSYRLLTGWNSQVSYTHVIILQPSNQPANPIPAHSPEPFTHHYNEGGGQSRWQPMHASPSTHFLRSNHNSFIAVLVRISATLCELFLGPRRNMTNTAKRKKTSAFFTLPLCFPVILDDTSGTPCPLCHMWLQPENVPYKKKKKRFLFCFFGFFF